MHDIRLPVPDGDTPTQRPGGADGFAVGKAVGILMERYGVDEATACELIAEIAMRTRTPLERLVVDIVEQPPVGPALDATQIRWLHGIDLSAREVDVLRLLAQGRSNNEIGDELFIGAETVKTHVARIFTKIGVTSRAQAVAWAYRCSCTPRFVAI